MLRAARMRDNATLSLLLNRKELGWIVLNRVACHRSASQVDFVRLLTGMKSGWPLFVELGELAMKHIAEGNLDAARQWLGWAADRQRPYVRIFDSFAGSPFARIWMMGNKDDDSLVRIAAAALMSVGDRSGQSITVLKDQRDKAT